MPPYHILIVEDDAGVRALLMRVIERISPTATIKAVGNGAAALAAFREHTADLVITDERMPLLNGLPLVRALRALPFSGPIIMLSMYLTHSTVAYAAGVTHYLPKPFSIIELQNLLRNLLPAQRDEDAEDM